MLLGQITQEHINDMLYIIAEYGATMIKQVKNAENVEMKKGEIWDALKVLQKETNGQFLHM